MTFTGRHFWAASTFGLKTLAGRGGSPAEEGAGFGAYTYMSGSMCTYIRVLALVYTCTRTDIYVLPGRGGSPAEEAKLSGVKRAGLEVLDPELVDGIFLS